MEIVFVILNYNTYVETVECIDSIHSNLDTDDYMIIIVDNGSKDSSVSDLRDKYKNSDKVEILETHENIGFAKGNNVGIKYANEHYRPEFMVVLNSDTELIQNDLYSRLRSEYKKSGFALLGPLVLNADGRCDNNPHYPPSYEHVVKELENFEKERKIIRWGIYRPYCGFRYFKELIKNKFFKKQKAIHRNMEFHQYQQQVVLQGCFLVFSNKAFDYVGGFMPDTFLYYEEPILYLELMKHNLVTVYNPQICIYHKDGRATKTVTKNPKERLLFVNQCYQDSARVLLIKLRAWKERCECENK